MAKKAIPRTRRDKAATVRTYRHGLGDCHLVTLRQKSGAPFHVMIDCGLILGADQNAVERLKTAVEDIATTTNGFVDVLVATHEHWDHLSGFLDAGEVFESGRLRAGEVWLGWTENPRDALAKKLKKSQAQALAGLQKAAASLKSLDARTADGVSSLLGFFGASGKRTTAEALETVRGLGSGEPRYCRPDEEPWTSAKLPGVRIYTLGPPRSETLIRRLNSSTETYALAEAAFHATVADPQVEDHQPFEHNHRLPLAELGKSNGDASVLGGFFQRRYYGLDLGSAEPDQAWRRIDGEWLAAAQHYALKLDNATNNTSLVLAIELSPGGKVLLFAADAQVGSWLSWQDLRWTVGDRTITGPELLRRTVFYKVGHHGSHNATLKQKGLELMAGEGFTAFVPVDQEMASKLGWGRMPLQGLMEALNDQSNGRAVRTDQEYRHPPNSERGWLRATDLYYEYVVKP
jgi:hypothetical protein